MRSLARSRTAGYSGGHSLPGRRIAICSGAQVRFSVLTSNHMPPRPARRDEPLPERAPVRELEMVPTRGQYLYELEDPNVSGRGVTHVILARTAAEALMQLRASAFDFHKGAVLFDPLPDDELAPVSAAGSMCIAAS
jgi:hypothetical protein